MLERASELEERRFWAEIEGRPWDQIKKVWTDKLLRQLEYLQVHSEFYKRKFQKEKIDIKSVKDAGTDLEYLPFK